MKRGEGERTFLTAAVVLAGIVSDIVSMVEVRVRSKVEKEKERESEELEREPAFSLSPHSFFP